MRPLATQESKSKASDKSAEPAESTRTETGKHKAVITPLPANPGYESVQGGQFTIPGWALGSQESESSDAGHIDVYPGQAAFPGSFGSLGYGGVGLGGSAFAGIPGGGFAAGIPGGYSAGIPTGRIPFAGGLLGGLLNGGGLLGAYGGYGGYGGIGGYGAYGGFRALSRQSPLGPGLMQIQTRPSPASGNYYQPSTGDSSASGNYYSSGGPWQVPISGPVTSPKDYWGPMGNPFK